MKYFVFGANGYVGNYLYNRLKEDKEDVIGTSYQMSAEYVFYDIRENVIPMVFEEDDLFGKVAIICIAKANIDDCYVHFQDAYDVNVSGMKNLINALLERGFYVIYFSSDCVFDGKKGNYTEESQRCPVNKYGAMKAEMEEYILKNNLPVTIFRISRVISPKSACQNPFSQLQDWSKNGVIRCIKGNYLSYVSVEDIYRVSKIVAEKKLYGLYNVCGDEKYSRKELADKFLASIGEYGKEIIDVDIEDFGFQEDRPLNVSMCNRKIRDMTGYRFTPLDRVIEEYIQHNFVSGR